MGVIPLEALSSHGSELKTGLNVNSRRGYYAWSGVLVALDLPQKPVSRPIAKQLVSLLNEAERATGPDESSMVGRVFILSTCSCL